MLMMFTYTYLMLAGVFLMFTSVDLFNIPPLHHYMSAMIFVIGGSSFFGRLYWCMAAQMLMGLIGVVAIIFAIMCF